MFLGREKECVGSRHRIIQICPRGAMAKTDPVCTSLESELVGEIVQPFPGGSQVSGGTSLECSAGFLRGVLFSFLT